MRTVICHFYNEAYLLPWWIKHHREIFDYGVFIDHGSTDESADICRELAPHWRLVRSRLNEFDAYLTDFEVMEYERELPGWKIALNITEFLLTTKPLAEIEESLLSEGRKGCASTGMIIVDEHPGIEPDQHIPLPLQYHFGVDDNAVIPEKRKEIGLPSKPSRNRFFHCNTVGMYTPGRHKSFHPDYNHRSNEMIIFHYQFAPWTEKGIDRKMQIAQKLPAEDINRNWGVQHLKDQQQLEADLGRLKEHCIDLKMHDYVGSALNFSCKY